MLPLKVKLQKLLFKMIFVVTLLDCSSTNRKKRTASSQTQHVTLTTDTAEKFDIESLTKSNQSNSIRLFPMLFSLTTVI